MTFTDAERTSMTTTSYTAFLCSLALVLFLFAFVAQGRSILSWISRSVSSDVRKGWMLHATQPGREHVAGSKEHVAAVLDAGKVDDIERETKIDGGAGSPFFPPPSSSLLYTTSNTTTLHVTNHEDSSSPYPSTKSLPLHLPSLLPVQLLRPLPAFLLKIHLDITLGQALILLTYAAAAGLAVFWFSDPTTDPVRSGVLATVQLPVLVALGSKNSIISALIGRSSETFNFLHRFVGRCVFLFSCLHAGFYFHAYRLDGSFSTSLQLPLIWTGWLAWLAMLVVVLTSLPIIRRQAFQFFLVTHTLGFLLLLVALLFHVPLCIPFCSSALGLYGLDLFVRFAIKTRARTATFKALEDGKTTMVEVEDVTGGWRNGQFVYVRVLSPSLGPLKMLESHPFTIATSASGSDPLRLFIKAGAPGSWTSSLYDFARSPRPSSSLEASLAGRKGQILLDGPYGGSQNLYLSAFSSVCLVAGGSGISSALGHLATLLDYPSLISTARPRSVDLVWIVPTYTSVVPFLPYLLPLIRECTVHAAIEKAEKLYPTLPTGDGSLVAPGRKMDVNVRIWVTRPRASDRETAASIPTVNGLSVEEGRPDLETIVKNTVDKTIKETLGVGYGLGIGVCGPAGLVRSTREVVVGLNAKDRRSVGGVEVFAEHFGV